MKVLGLIVEYNPFHNGHKLHLEKAKKLVKPDYTIAVMSGNFVQRGEPAILNKFIRTQMALSQGIDLIIELPFIYSIQDASGFANGSIGILSRLGIVTDLVFGSESADIDTLHILSDILVEEPKEFKKILRTLLKTGLSFPKARSIALKNYVSEHMKKSINLEVIEKSNDILGLEYLTYLKKYKSTINASLIKREGASYNETSFTGNISSATAVRKLLRTNDYDLVNQSIPKECFDILKEKLNNGETPVFYETMNEIILSALKLSSKNEIKNYYGVNEGLEKRIIEKSFEKFDISELISEVKSKRTTYSRLKRTMLNILFKIETKKIETYNLYGPQYFRVLGFNEKGQKVLKMIKENSKYPIISNISKYENIYNRLKQNFLDSNKKYEAIPEILLEQLEYDLKAANIYDLICKNKIFSEFKKNENFI
jgi:predicted nucleotidyltransferase